MFRKLLDQAQTGDNIGALLRGVQRNEIERGQVLCSTGNNSPTYKVQGTGIRTEEGRRRKTYTILQRIQTTVLLQNNRRNRRICSFRKEQRCACLEITLVMEIELITQDRYRRRTQIRYS